MLIGCVLGICAILTCLMCFTKHSKNAVFQKWNHAIHKMIGWVMLLLSITHFILVWPLRLQRPVMMYILGVFMIVFITGLVTSYYLRSKLGKGWRIWHRVLACAVVICLIGHVYLGIHSFQIYKTKVDNISITQVDLKSIPDGEYFGEENVQYIYCRVKATVKNHEMVSVDILEHRNERGKPAERLIDDILKMQSNKVDAVSSATNSSKVIMKAVENALQCNEIP